MTWMPVTAFAQSNRGSIAGSVSDPSGIVAGATVEAKEKSTGKVYTATSGKTGQFTIGGLPPGMYELFVPPLGFRTDSYTKASVTVDAGKTSTVDIALKFGNQGVIGDDNAYLAIRGKYGSISGKAPRMPDGKPDLSGVWNASLMAGEPEPGSMLPWAVDELKHRRETRFRDMPSSRCLPSDAIPSAPLLYKIVQTRSLFLQLFEHEPHYRQVFMDGRGHPANLDPTWMGHSIGRWEKDTLVIDTVGLNDRSWLTLDGYPHTERLHITERYRRPDLGHLLVDVTLEDPGTFLTPVAVHAAWELAPGEEILESICAENNRYQENAGLK